MDVHSAAVLRPLSFALSRHQPVAGRGLQGGAGFLITVSEGPAFTSWSHTSVLGVGRTIVRNPKVTVHDNCYSFELWSKTVRNSCFSWKKNRTLKLYHIVKINFLPFSGLAQTLVLMKNTEEGNGVRHVFLFGLPPSTSVPLTLLPNKRCCFMNPEPCSQE